jgi:hypothetical protein
MDGGGGTVILEDFKRHFQNWCKKPIANYYVIDNVSEEEWKKFQSEITENVYVNGTREAKWSMIDSSSAVLSEGDGLRVCSYDYDAITNQYGDVKVLWYGFDTYACCKTCGLKLKQSRR